MCLLYTCDRMTRFQTITFFITVWQCIIPYIYGYNGYSPPPWYEEFPHVSIFINTPAAGHFFLYVSLLMKSKVYFDRKDPTRNLFALLIHIIVNRDNLKKKRKKEDFWGNFRIALPSCLSETRNIMMYVPFDMRSFWLNMYCLYHSVLTIIMKWDEKWWWGGNKQMRRNWIPKQGYFHQRMFIGGFL